MAKNHGKINYISMQVETRHAFLTTTPEGKMHVERGYFMLKGRKESLQTEKAHSATPGFICP